MRIFIFLNFLIFCVSITNAARILCFFPNPSKSHILLAVPICEELSLKGHHVVTVTNFKMGKNTATYKNVVIKRPGFADDLFGQLTSGKQEMSVKFILRVSDQFREDAIQTIKSTEFQAIMKEDKFDLIFFIPVFFNNVQLGVADHFKSPWIGLTPMGNIRPVRDLLGSHSLPATVPSHLLHAEGALNFKQRLQNFMFNMLEFAVSNYMDRTQKQDYEALFPITKYRSYEEMKDNCSLMFLNEHFSDTGIPRPLLPNEIELGGIQIKTKPAPLTGHLKDFLNNATDGAILWTFGTNVPVSTTQPDKVDIMLKILSKSKYKVILKWESTDKTRLPENVFPQDWLPQDSILAHPNLKLFIGHGGKGGLGEAKYHQVPILGMPFFGDQDGNMAKIEEEGWGRQIKLHEITEQSFSEILNDILTNKKYRENVKRCSDKYRDRIATPLDTAVFWVEYIMKHHGAPHLSYSGKSLNFVQRHSLDVIGLLAAILYCFYRLVKFLFCLCCGRRNTTVDKHKKKN